LPDSDAFAVDPDLFITIAFVSLVVAFALAGFAFALHERRRERAAAEDDAAAREKWGRRPMAAAPFRGEHAARW
jgi:hypothetical protein